MTLRPASLFWTFAGAFLLVLVVAAAMQALVIMAVVGPITSRLMSARAELIGREVRAAVEAELARTTNADVAPTLRALGADTQGLLLIYRSADGRITAHPPFVGRRLRELLRSEGDTLGAPELGRGWRQSPDRQARRDPEREPPPAPERGPRFPGLGDPPPPPGDAADQRRPRLQVLARLPVTAMGSPAGEIIVLGPRPRLGLPPLATARRLLLFVPVAVLVAGAAALVMFRLVLRRLRKLEALADRVTAGDLAVSIEDSSRDELGRLADRLNGMTESLREARERVDAADRQRRQLFADITHELATPLTSIRGYTETLLNPEVVLPESDRKRHLQDVLEESRRMERLIEDLLELTRLEAGATPLETERLDWRALCWNTVERYQTRFRAAGIAIDWSGEREGAWVVADGHRLEQVIENLLTNALRYVPRGGNVTVAIEPAAGDRHGYRLTVTDDGPGIPEDDLPHVFDRFYRADAARSTEGTGLGLAIVREIIERHGGRVQATNRQPHGTVFSVELS